MVDFDETRFNGYRAVLSTPCDQFQTNLAVSDMTRFAHSANLLEAVNQLENSPQQPAQQPSSDENSEVVPYLQVYQSESANDEAAQPNPQNADGDDGLGLKRFDDWQTGTI